jgi:hypothetical protein
MGYQYALHQHKKKLREERDMFRRNRDDDSTSSGGYWDEYSDALESSMERHRDPKHNRRTTTQVREESYVKNQSAQQSKDEEDFIQETPEAALVAAQAYLLTTQPEPRDPREHMHQAAIRSLRLVENRLMGNLPEEKVTHRKERRKEEFKRQPSRKYDGSQEPTLWLSDYLQAVQILGRTRATAMQSLQLHLTGVARSWLNTLPNDSIGSWGELENQFMRNFHSTYKRPTSLEEVKSCVQ